MFDGSRTTQSVGAGIVIESPIGRVIEFSFQLDFDCSKNQAEYEALIIGLEILIKLKARNGHILGDSQLATKQLNGEYN